MQIRLPREYSVIHQHFEPGEIIFNQSALGDNVYVIDKAIARF